MAFDRVTRQSSQLDATLFELSNQLLYPAKFRGTNRCKVSRMAEQNGPGVTNPFVKVHLTLSGVSSEVGDGVTEFNVGHVGKEVGIGLLANQVSKRECSNFEQARDAPVVNKFS